jgi:glutamyl-tRNA reductase
MGPLTPEQEMAVEALTRGIINKVMHTPITTLKTAAREAEATTVIDVVRRLFNLHNKEKGPASQTGDGEASGKNSRDRGMGSRRDA